MPLLLNTCTVDQQFPETAQSQADAIFGEGKFKPGYKREYFDGVRRIQSSIAMFISWYRLNSVRMDLQSEGIWAIRK